MRIPDNQEEREALYDDVIAQCEKSQEDRRISYDKFRSYYLYASDNEAEEVPFNKIYPHLDTVLSFMFASETARFSVTPSPGQSDIENLRTGIFGDAINSMWHQSNADIVVSNAILWGLVFNSMVVKVVPLVNQSTKELQINPFTVHPATIGVYREDVPFFGRQQAIVQTYYTTEDELDRRLEGHPNRDKIIDALTPATNQEGEGTSAMARVLMGAWQPVGSATPANGNLSFNLSSDMGYLPEQMDKLRVLKELWIWDDKLNDYRIVTRPKDGGISIYDEENFYLKGEHPFVQFCPRPLPFYVWGESEVGGLIGLQRWRNQYIGQIRDLLERQLKPPTTATGFGMIEEGAYAKFIAGSILSDGAGGMGMGAKVETFAPNMPQDVYRIVSEIDNSFNEYSGLPNTVQGKGDVGVRSGKQAGELARLGSARIKKRALVIEDALERMAHLYAQLMQKHDATTYSDKKGNVFVLSQFTKQYEVKVDAHSSSPVFVEDKRDMASFLLERNLIKPERALEMIDPPDKQAALHELPEIKAQQAAAAQAESDAQLKREALKHAPEGFMQKLLAKLFPG